MKIAFFDFDGTITTKDTLFDFIKFAVGKKRFLIGMFRLIPILFGYKLKLIPNYKAKERMLSLFFQGMTKYDFIEVANKYALEKIDLIIHPKALETLNWHKEQNHKIVIVSASIDCWIRPWCERNDFELLSTKLEFKDNILTGKFLTKNCYGIEKVNRIKEMYNLNNFEYIYVYGDSEGDKQMLELGNESFYRLFI